MRDDFDPEGYLRLAGERWLLSSRAPDPDTVGPIGDVASALVAIDRLPATSAQRIVDDYVLAATLRGDREYVPMHMLSGDRSPVTGYPLAAPRVVVCNAQHPTPWGSMEIHLVALSDESTSVRFTARESSPGALMASLQNAGMPPQAKFVDDRGTTVDAYFSGGSGGGQYDGRLTSHQPLARDTKWIELGDARIDLGESADVEVVVERMPAAPPAARCLWTRLGASEWGWRATHGSIDTLIETFVAAGELAAADPVVADVRAVAAALDQGSPAPGAALPHPWSSLFRAAATGNARTGLVALGAASGSIDGAYVAFEHVDISDENFTVHVKVSPGAAFQPLPDMHEIGAATLTFWAEDDLGNHYLGRPGNWGGGPEECEGELEFWPSLDPRAQTLALRAEGARHRAVLRVPLPEAGVR